MHVVSNAQPTPPPADRLDDVFRVVVSSVLFALALAAVAVGVVVSHSQDFCSLGGENGITSPIAGKYCSATLGEKLVGELRRICTFSVLAACFAISGLWVYQRRTARLATAAAGVFVMAFASQVALL